MGANFHKSNVRIQLGREKTAWELKREHPEYLMAGERGGVILPGVDFGNSPSQTEHADFQDKILIHTTSAGTQGLVHTCAAGAGEILTGSLVNASAIASYIKSRNPERVSLVCMGNSGITPAPEDELCARYIRSILTGEPIEMGPEILSLVNEPSVAKFFDIRWKDVFPVKDLIMCLEYDRFPFVLKACQCGDDIFEITRQSSICGNGYRIMRQTHRTPSHRQTPGDFCLTYAP